VSVFTQTVADACLPAPVLPAGLQLHLDNLKIYNPTALAKGPQFSGNVLVAPGATVGQGCLIGPDVSIGDGCVIGDGVRLSNCVVMRGVRVKDHSKVSTCGYVCVSKQAQSWLCGCVFFWVILKVAGSSVGGLSCTGVPARLRRTAAR
jgi:carbonic anhydrase/acetyltransferase-like protein (isoleucine patch superfamily)